MVISGGNFKPDTLKPKEVVSLLLDDEELEAKCKQKREREREKFSLNGLLLLLFFIYISFLCFYRSSEI